jgi:hypothetical protein
MSANQQMDNEPSGKPQGGQGVTPHGNVPDKAHPVPLFLRGGSDGRKDDAQDEKDETAE